MMKLKNIPIGSKIQCCGATAVVLSHGVSGVRVNILTLKKVDYPGFVLGFQIWSGESDVESVTEIDAEGSKCLNTDVSTPNRHKVP